ncbi:sensor domain-containing diguanylate cyclase [Mycobacterium sp. ITM-2016-00317]|uniref:GGDEF domain-containing protein n=1 Tax=Mycobacterium sp. ITM-2016-00317 TaxID=2099694 RepID=UPI00287F40C0|nr:sensor domain-containing diguanylate cyclase [Mycobacterium sp. ITM-2016-00317]WNG87448.1 sensor domain-containing diguanylate cyclase [Mycobacterium sp. ITM-2016-00317]
MQGGTGSRVDGGTGTLDGPGDLRALTALLRISEAVSRADHLDEVLEVIAGQAMAVLGAASVSICRAELDRDAARVMIKLGDPAPSECELAAPVVVGGVTWGEISVTGAGGRRFDGRDAELLHEIAAHTAVAVSRSELLTTVWRYAFEDPLTGIANRRAIDRRMSEIDWCTGYPAALICDLDGFKRINDRDGHPAGDRLLRGVARELHRLTSAIDGAVAARLGGDEFCVLLPDATLASAQVFAMDATAAIRADVTSEVTVSWGAAVAGPEIGDGDALLAAADAALMEAKRQGPAHYSTAEPGPEAPAALNRRVTEARPPLDLLPGMVVEMFSQHSDLTVATAMELLVMQVQLVTGVAAWAVSEHAPGSAALRTVRSVDSVHRDESGLRVLTDLGPSTYELARYPTSARAVTEGSTFVAAVDLADSDPAEVALLARLGYAAVLGVGVLAGHRNYLLEFFSHDGHHELARIGPMVEVLGAYCVSRLSGNPPSRRRP